MKSRLTIRQQSYPSQQQGMALLGIVIMLMIVITLLSMTSARNTVLETKTVFNLQDKQRSFHGAESAVMHAWDDIKKNADLTKIVDAEDSGYYILGDNIDGSESSNKQWLEIKNVMSWPWKDPTKRFAIPTQVGGTENPMKLLTNPQYAIGINNAVTRKGMSNYRCVPFNIIGASQGGTEQTRTLIELKAVPSRTCFRDKIK